MSRFSFMVLPSCTPVTAVWTLSWLLLLASGGKAVEQGGSLPVCLSICVQRAALKTPPPFGRTLSFPKSAARLSRGADSCPQASCGPLPQILSSRRGSGSRRHTRWASMYRRQRTNQKKRSKHHVQQSHPHRPPRTKRRSQNRSEQPRVRRPQHCNPGELEER